MVERIFVKLQDGKTVIITLWDGPEGTTVEELKAKIQDHNGVPCDQQRLIFNGNQMEDGRMLSYFGIKDESTVHQVLLLRGGGDIKKEDGMGDKTGKNRSREKLCDF